MTPQPYVTPDEATLNFVLEKYKTCGYFNEEQLSWIESILARQDAQPGMGQLAELTELVMQCHAVPSPDQWDSYKRRMNLMKAYHAAQMTSYKQRHVIVGVPQRQKHPKYDIPNCTNIRAWQEYRISLTTVYGMGFAESRTHLVNVALADPTVTHLIFLDDDILMPQDAIPKLLRANLPIVAGIYLKKNEQLESTVTKIDEDPKYVYSQFPVRPDLNGKPIPVSVAGAGLLCVDMDVFKKLPQPWFQFIKGPDGRVMVGEDAYFLHNAAKAGFPPYCDPSVIGVHVDFRDGWHYGPEEIVDMTAHKIRPEWVGKYTSFPPGFDIKELNAKDVVDVFNRNNEVWDGRK